MPRKQVNVAGGCCALALVVVALTVVGSIIELIPTFVTGLITLAALIGAGWLVYVMAFKVDWQFWLKTSIFKAAKDKLLRSTNQLARIKAHRKEIAGLLKTAKDQAVSKGTAVQIKKNVEEISRRASQVTKARDNLAKTVARLKSEIKELDALTLKQARERSPVVKDALNTALLARASELNQIPKLEEKIRLYDAQLDQADVSIWQIRNTLQHAVDSASIERSESTGDISAAAQELQSVSTALSEALQEIRHG